MPLYDITGPDGAEYEVDAPDDASVQEAVQKMFGGGSPAAPPADPAVGQLRDRLLATPGGAGTIPPSVLTRDPKGAELTAAPEPSVLRTIGFGMQQSRKGLTSLLGGPVDAINQSPRLMNLLPGVDNVQPFMENPPLGSQNWEYMATGAGTAEPIQPAGALDRVIGRVGYELGATALPLTGALAYGPRMGVDAARRMATRAPSVAPASIVPGVQALDQGARYAGNAVRNIAGTALETAAVAPERLLIKELAAGGAGGLGAGLMNEAVGNPQTGDNFGSDFAGSLVGVGALSTATDLLRGGQRLASAALGKPKWMDDVAGQEVVDRIMNNSTMMADQVARTGSLDTRPLATQLRTQAPIEEAVPGYQANIGDRSRDAGLQTFAFNQDNLSPGASSTRRTANELAIDERMGRLAPRGNAGQFRDSLQASVDERLNIGGQQALDAQRAAEAAANAAQPMLATGEARGGTMRTAIQDAYDARKTGVDRMWDPIDQAQQPIDIAPLAERYGALDEGLSFNERQRFRPSEADVPAQLMQPATPPQPTGLLDAQGKPIIRPGEDPSSIVPLRELSGIRSGLTDDTRAQRAGNRPAQARVTDQYRRELDEFADGAVPPELRQQFDTARQGTYDLKEDFTRRGTAMQRTLQTREGGGYALPDSAVAPQFNQTDRGRLSDFNDLMRHAGKDPLARQALTDEVKADVQRRGLTDKPDGLNRYLAERGVLLDEFPDLRRELEAVSQTRLQQTDMEKAAAALNQKLTTPGRSAEADYLQYSNDRVLDAVRTVVNNTDPRQAARDLLTAAGDTPLARENARTAFWSVVRNERNLAPGTTGNPRWSVDGLRKILLDPKKTAVMDELWRDAPEQLADTRRVFEALSGAEGSTRARVPGSSGTAQSLAGKFDSSLSATSVASRLRNVQRRVVSPTITAIDIASTWLRNRSKKVQERAIDQLTSSVINNPNMAADLLEKFNPADYAAKRRMIFQKYGVRATQVLNLLDEAQNHDPTIDAITEK